MRGLITARTAVMPAVAAIDADIGRMAGGLGSLTRADYNPRRWAVDRSRPCGCGRRFLAHPSIVDIGAYLGLVAATLEVHPFGAESVAEIGAGAPAEQRAIAVAGQGAKPIGRCGEGSSEGDGGQEAER